MPPSPTHTPVSGEDEAEGAEQPQQTLTEGEIHTVPRTVWPIWLTRQVLPSRARLLWGSVLVPMVEAW